MFRNNYFFDFIFLSYDYVCSFELWCVSDQEKNTVAGNFSTPLSANLFPLVSSIQKHREPGGGSPGAGSGGVTS